MYKDSKDYDKNKFVIEDDNRYYFDTKTRWSNLGWHYDWDHRCYFPNSRSEIPTELRGYALEIVEALDLQSYNPEAVIVNYYSNKDAMGGHLDDGEPDQIHPIVSFSLGLSCIFMMGGATKTVKPKAVLLESGDVCVMNKFSRLCYHGVPKIIPNSFKLPEDFDVGSLNIKETTTGSNRIKHAVNYLKDNRINFNFRQVVTD